MAYFYSKLLNTLGTKVVVFQYSMNKSIVEEERTLGKNVLRRLGTALVSRDTHKLSQFFIPWRDPDAMCAFKLSRAT